MSLWQRWMQLPRGLSRIERHWYRIALVVLPAGGLAHVGLLVIFAALGFDRLALVNIGSIACWALGSWLLKLGRLKAANLLILVELLVHAALATWELGVGSGFPIYLLTVPAVAAMAPRSSRGFAMLCTAISLLTLVAMLSRDLLLGPPEVSSTLTTLFLVGNVSWVFILLYAWSATFEQLTARAEADLAIERDRSEHLLHNILPHPIAERLKADPGVIADRFEHASVLFADLVGFTRLSQRVDAAALVRMLDDIFSAIDDLADAHGLEKIKTIGDAYMVAAGIPEPVEDHALRITRFGLAMVRVVERYGQEHQVDLQLRVGVHSGPVVAGVIGKRKFAYDLWGDTVNTASRMESHGVPGRVQVSPATRALLGAELDVESRGTIDIKGKDPMETFLITAESG